MGWRKLSFLVVWGRSKKKRNEVKVSIPSLHSLPPSPQTSPSQLLPHSTCDAMHRLTLCGTHQPTNQEATMHSLTSGPTSPGEKGQDSKVQLRKPSPAMTPRRKEKKENPCPGRSPAHCQFLLLKSGTRHFCVHSSSSTSTLTLTPSLPLTRLPQMPGKERRPVVGKGKLPVRNQSP